MTASGNGLASLQTTEVYANLDFLRRTQTVRCLLSTSSTYLHRPQNVVLALQSDELQWHPFRKAEQQYTRRDASWLLHSCFAKERTCFRVFFSCLQPQGLTFNVLHGFFPPFPPCRVGAIGIFKIEVHRVHMFFRI